MSIPCYFADGTPMSESTADMIMRAFGWQSAHHAERVIGVAEERRRRAYIVSHAEATEHGDAA
ncbi:hypothetical protein [Nocardia sp. CNY236]|uniref:hypothetical protein n=1 Tax=Nocardia sp. CNY236 TaxID=1169152 RepID=UPI0004012ED0|nr:hypothetical protein [Nocardia sp. CNY236]